VIREKDPANPKNCRSLFLFNSAEFFTHEHIIVICAEYLKYFFVMILPAMAQLAISNSGDVLRVMARQKKRVTAHKDRYPVKIYLHISA